MLAGLTCATCSGCLVTDQVEFPTEENIPPWILDAPGNGPKQGQIIWIDKSVTTMWRMTVRVRDENVDQDLIAHWRLVSKDEDMPEFQKKKLAGAPGGPLIRQLDFDVQADTLHDGQCDRLELAVSGSFFDSDLKSAPKYFLETNGEDDSDLATTSWIIWEGKGQNQADLMHIGASCPTNESLLMPAAMMQAEVPP